MPRALEALGPTLRRLEQGETAAVEAIDALLSEDCALRETRRIDIALRTAKVPMRQPPPSSPCPVDAQPETTKYAGHSKSCSKQSQGTSV